MSSMDAINGTYESRTGSVFVRHFDKAIKEYLGELNTTKNIYELIVPELGEDQVVRLIAAQPEQTKTLEVLPAIVIRRTSIAPALQRMMFLTTTYRVPAEGSVELEVTLPITNEVRTGYSLYEQAQQSWTYDISYDLEIATRYEEDAVILLEKVMRKFPPHEWLPVEDSLGDTRLYAMFQEGVDDVSELIDMVMRVRGFSVAVRIEGELDLKDPIISRAALDRSITIEHKELE